MTVNVEVPYIRYVGNGSSTHYAFEWSQQDIDELKVTIAGLLMERQVDYNVQDYTDEHGGVVVFPMPTLAGAEVLLYRETPVTQQVDYVENAAFPAETHEGQMDKDTRILQEIIHAGRGQGGPVDLEAYLGPNYVDILNNRGTDAHIPGWECMTPLAGVFHGEVTTSMPEDGTLTTKPDGYIWWEIGP